MKTTVYPVLSLLALLVLCLPATCQVSSCNYLMSRTMLNSLGSAYLDDTGYYDGLGRPFQKVHKAVQGGEVQHNLVTLQEYDVYGRLINEWLPIPASVSYVTPTTFKSTAPTHYGNDSRPYTQAVYEASALNRLLRQYGPGEAWYNSHPLATDHLVNTVSGELSCKLYTIGSEDIPVSTATYAGGQLLVLKSTDEDGGVEYRFTDKLGRLLLSRQMQGTEAHDTYYIYDSYGHPIFILQPMYQTVPDVDKYAFRYQYDSRNLCIRKTLPGTSPVEYVYDAACRLAFSQTGNQRTGNRWTYYLYDKYGRMTHQGECLNRVITSSPTLWMQHYYDDYSFLGTDGFPTAAYTAGNTFGRGLLTGSVVTVCGTDMKINKSYYYDVKGQVVKTIQNNLPGGYDIKNIVYSFSGQPTEVSHTHSAPGHLTRTEIYTYTYDGSDRIHTVEHRLNGTNVTLSNYTYDALGRSSTKSLHGGAANTLTYAYDLRSRLTGISSAGFTQNLYYHTGLGTACYNGNISSMTWKSGTENTLRGYRFAYDGLNRMTNAVYGEGYNLQSQPNRFSECVNGYDKNGNILSLERYGQTSSGSYGIKDQLSYTLSGNQLSRIENAATSGVSTYIYDSQGNLTQDSGKGISNIEYNPLDLPRAVTFSDGSTITYTYASDGTKLRTVHTMGGVVTTRDYCTNVIYENGAQQLLLTDEGYVSLSDGRYHYYLRDHLGNNRVVVDSDGVVEETNHYYPFGSLFADAAFQPYKYNGKELDTWKGLNWYDYGARMYDPETGRFTTGDPLGEKYYGIGSYVYCANNPVCYLDPDGRTIRVYDYANNQRIAYEWKDYQGIWGFYDNNNTLYAGNNAFIGQLSGALNGLMNGGQAGFDLVSGVANHSNVITMWKRNSSAVIGDDLGWNPIGIRRDGSLEAVPTTAGMRNDPMITLGHELEHVDYNWNVGNSATWFNMTVVGRNGNPTQRPIPISEICTTHMENRIRAEHGLPLRTHYGIDANNQTVGPRVIVPRTGASRYYNSQGVTNYRSLGRGVSPFIY